MIVLNNIAQIFFFDLKPLKTLLLKSAISKEIV